jgi:hypothetical protein
MMIMMMMMMMMMMMIIMMMMMMMMMMIILTMRLLHRSHMYLSTLIESTQQLLLLTQFLYFIRASSNVFIVSSMSDS